MSIADRLLKILDSFNPGIAGNKAVRVERSRRYKGVEITSPTATYLVGAGETTDCWTDDAGVHVCTFVPGLIDREDAIHDLLRQLFAGDPDLHPQLSPMEFALTRPQEECLGNLWDSFESGDDRGAVVLPPGMGKTVFAAHAIDLSVASKKVRAQKILFLAHQKELLEGARRQFENHLPGMAVGQVYGGVRRDGDIVLATVQSDPADLFDDDAFDLVIVDEAHHVMSKTYLRQFDHFRPKYWLGLTATPYRSDMQDPMEMFGGNYICSMSLEDAIVQGYLSAPQWKLVNDVTDTSEFVAEILGKDKKALRDVSFEEREASIVEAYKANARGRTVGFCYNRRIAKRMAQVFRAAGIKADAFTGEYSTVNGIEVADRDETLAAFRANRIDVLFTVALFDEGVDVPEIETVMFLRATSSPGRLFQNVGRGLRLAPGKRKALILDFMSNYDTAAALASLNRALGDEMPQGRESTGGGGGGGGASEDDDDIEAKKLGIKIETTTETKDLVRRVVKEVEAGSFGGRLAETYACFRKWYDAGLSDPEIGKKCDRGENSVFGWRRRKRLPPNARIRIDPACFRKWYDAGLSDPEIGKKCDRSGSSVLGWRRREKLPPNTQMLDTKVAACFRKWYDAGLSDHEIGKKCGRSGDSVFGWRRRKRLPPNARIRIDPKVAACFRKWYDAGLSGPEIGKKCGRSKTAVERWRKREGLPPNSR
jgi:superfamily II DNA or RNA helicase/transposase